MSYFIAAFTINIYVSTGIFVAGIHRGYEKAFGVKVPLRKSWKIMLLWPIYIWDLHHE